MSDPLAEALIKELESHGLKNIGFWATVGGIVVWGIGIVIGWFVAQRSTIAAVGKTKVETAAIQNELFQKLENVREKLNSQSESLGLRLRDLLGGIRAGTSEQANSLREEICRSYDAEYIPVLESYLEQIPRLLPRREQYLRLRSDIMPALATMCKLLDALNHDRLLVKCGSPAPFLLRRSGIEVLFGRVTDLCPIWRQEVRREIAGLERKISTHMRSA